MNYIGSKNKLLPFIADTIHSVVGGEVTQFTDLFAGTGVVGQHFKRIGAEVIANDIQYYSYILNKHFVENNEVHHFTQLDVKNSGVLFDDIYQSLSKHLNMIEGEQGFIFNNYTIGGTNERNYFSDENAKRCDAMRMKIEEWRLSGVISEYEYYHLLASLIESVDKVANTASVYGAYLKKLKKSAAKELCFELLPTIQSDKSHRVTNCDANELIKDIEGEVLYLDPPYNHRQYSANYHMLETIAKGDNPEIRGKTGLRENSNQLSRYCQKSRALDAFEQLIHDAKFDYIFLSYNNEGLIPAESIAKVLRSKGEYSVASRRYSRFKADSSRNYASDYTYEYLHCVRCR